MLLKKVVFEDGLRYRLDIDEVRRHDYRIYVPFYGRGNFVKIANNTYINTRNCHTYFGD